MATIDIIRFKQQFTSSQPDPVCPCNAPTITLVYDTDGPRGKYGNIMTGTINSVDTYHQIMLKAVSHVDVASGGELILNGFQLIDGDYVWLPGQLNPDDNGLYVVRTTSWEFISHVTPNMFIDLGARAHDDVLGDISRAIVTDISELNFTRSGFYSIKYYAMNTSGVLTYKTRKIKVIHIGASISPVPGYTISNYEIHNESLIPSSNQLSIT